jgi:hypothetical protein
MFEMRISELMKMENRPAGDGLEDGHGLIKPVHFKPSLMDRFLPSLGEAMITLGYKLKERPQNKLNTEQANSPNFLIML